MADKLGVVDAWVDRGLAEVVRSGGRATDAEARKWLRRSLPDYIVPSAFELLGWDGFHAGALTVRRLPGNHRTAFIQPEVRHVARAVLESLRETSAGGTALRGRRIG